MTDTTKPKSGGDLETEAMQVDEDNAAIKSSKHERLPQEVTNAVNNSGFAVWCKDNGLSDQVVEALWGAGFRTPKDLIDRKSDLKKLNLEIDDYMIIGGAIERMRNTSASSSVDSAVLGLATKDNQQHTAARDDSDFNNEDKAALSSLFARARQWLKDSTKETSDQEVIRRPLPHSMLLSKCFFGNSDQNLMNLVTEKGFSANDQQRRVIAVVQSFGYGKTKTALRLTKKFIVLPIRFQSQPNVEDRVVELICAAQTHLLNELGPLDTVDESMVRRMSDRCKSTVVLLLLSLLRVLDHCSKLGLIDFAKPADRALFAACASRLFNSDVIAQLMAKWFTLKLHLVTDDNGEKLRQLRDQLLTEKRQVPIVFFIDEVHQLQDKCKGYCLHETETDDIVNRWRGEQVGTLSPGHRVCTDLFYQLRIVMGNLIVLTNVVTPAFVLCSTWYGASQQLDDELFSGRGKTVRFDDFRTLTIEECKDFIQYYFRVPSSVFSDCDLSYFTRPLFISELIEKLAVAPPRCVTGNADVIKNWFTGAYKACKLYVYERATNRVNDLQHCSVAVDRSNSCSMLQLAYLSVRLVNGVIYGRLGDKTQREGVKYATVWDIMNHGVMRLAATERESCLVMDEPVFLDAIMAAHDTPEKQDEAVLGSMAHLLDIAYMQVPNDKALKGFTFEHVVAWLALRRKLSLTAFPDEAQLETWLTGSSAAQYCQLQLPVGEENLYVQKLLKGGLKGDNKLDRVLLPSTQCGPDVLFHGRNGDHFNVAVQVKVQQTHYTYSNLVEALASLAPAHMYSKRRGLAKASLVKKVSMAALAGKVKKERKTEMREQWVAFVKDEWPKFPYHRVVFAALGFTNEAQHAVVEFNLRERERTAKNREAPSYIHLLNLDDVNEGNSQSALQGICDSVKAQLSNDIVPNVRQTMPLYGEWRALSESKAFQQFRADVQRNPRTTSPIRKQQLEDFCRMWGVAHSGKTIPELMDALDKHADDVERYCQELRLELCVA